LKKFKVYLSAVVLCTVVGSASVAHELGDEASMEEQAFTVRDSIFHVIGWNMGLMGGMAKGEIPSDDAAFVEAANNIVVLSKMIGTGFIPNSIIDGSIAKPEIWEDMDDFMDKAAALTAKAEEVAAAAASGGVAAGGVMLKDLGQTCGGCHREYKVKTDG
jgi:cytochrome c556